MRDGRLVVMPTSTLWGIGADGLNPQARRAVARLKRRKDLNFVHLVHDIEVARRYGVLEGCALELARAFWPGPLTIVVKATEAARIAKSESGTIALRVDPHPVAQALTRLVGRPLISTSANLSGEEPPVIFSQISPQILEGVYGVVRGDPPGGIASTIVRCEHDEVVLIREGALSRDELLGRA